MLTLVGCNSKVQIQDIRVSKDKTFEVVIRAYFEGAELIDGKLKTIYYVNVSLKDLHDDSYNFDEENKYHIKIYAEEGTLVKLNNLLGDRIEVKAKELIPDWVKY